MAPKITSYCLIRNIYVTLHYIINKLIFYYATLVYYTMIYRSTHTVVFNTTPQCPTTTLLSSQCDSPGNFTHFFLLQSVFGLAQYSHKYGNNKQYLVSVTGMGRHVIHKFSTISIDTSQVWQPSETIIMIKCERSPKSIHNLCAKTIPKNLHLYI